MRNALSLWRPRELSTLHEEIDDLFNRFFGPDEHWFSSAWDRALTPAVESFVKDGELVVRVDVPGIDPKDVELSIENDRLHITGERKREEEKKGREYLYREVNFGRFERIVPLPAGVDPDTVKAAYRDGVLEISMRAPKEMVAKKVPITVH